ncbi:hypothetical protein ACXYTP_17735 [Tsukamurella ocularis]
MTEHQIPGVGHWYGPDDRRGILTFEHLPADLRAAEDTRAVADRDFKSGPWRPDRCQGGFWRLEHVDDRTEWTRPATTTEKLLLRHLGYLDLPDDLRTVVDWHQGLRRRRWPTLTHNPEGDHP